MKNQLINKCPSCGEDLSISSLKCNKCGLTINGEFDIPGNTSNAGNDLTEDEQEFVKLFLKYEGNISRLVNRTGMSFIKAKTLLRQINIKLGNEEELPGLVNYQDRDDREDKLTASGEIKNKFNECGGVAECPMVKGKPLKIWMTKEGVCNSAFPSLICEWRVFDAILEKAIALGGKMYRGDAAAQNGYKIGSEELPIDTIDSFISLNFYGKKMNETTLRRSTYYSAIMAWAGLCTNHRSDGEGGYILVNPAWLD